MNNRRKRTIADHFRYVICMVMTTAMTSQTEFKIYIPYPFIKMKWAHFLNDNKRFEIFSSNFVNVSLLSISKVEG